MSYTLSAREIAVVSAVVEYGSLTAAARHLGVSQPSISQTVGDVEASTGLAFFLRKGRSVEPTAAARLIAREGVSVAHALERVTRMVEALRAGASDHLTIAAMPAFGESFVAEVVAQFSRNNPDIACNLVVSPRAALEEGLVDGFFDIGVGTLPAQGTDVVSVASKETEVACVMPPGHRLSGRDRVSRDDLKGERLLLLAPGSPLRGVLDTHLGNFTSNTAQIMANTQQALVTMVIQGAGIAIIDPLNLTRLEREAVAVRPLDPPLHYQLGILHRRGKPRSPAQKSLIDALCHAIEARSPIPNRFGFAASAASGL